MSVRRQARVLGVRLHGLGRDGRNWAVPLGWVDTCQRHLSALQQHWRDRPTPTLGAERAAMQRKQLGGGPMRSLPLTQNRPEFIVFSSPFNSLML